MIIGLNYRLDNDTEAENTQSVKINMENTISEPVLWQPNILQPYHCPSTHGRSLYNHLLYIHQTHQERCLF